jgi:UDP-N-acetylglucosamine 2-epimerase (non-hydrolysing)
MAKHVLHLIAAARPNFMKVAPLYHALAPEAAWAEPVIVHTGQHYDASMSDAFFADLQLPAPRVNLEIGSGTHAEQTGKVMIAYERYCLEHRPDWVIVVGDVNSTLACGIVAKKLELPLAHLEAGIRSGDRTMPEEINRIATDAISDLLWTPTQEATDNLLRAGIPESRIDYVGNVMIDSFELLRARIEATEAATELGLDGDFAAVTLHRPANVDRRETLSVIVEALIRTAERMKLVFAIHPRTEARLAEFGLSERLRQASAIRAVGPMGYVRFMALVRKARLVITDSGSIQGETSYLGILCLTLRTTTEWPITLSQGTNRLIAPHDLLAAVDEALAAPRPAAAAIPLWDGKTAGRVVRSLRRACGIAAP